MSKQIAQQAIVSPSANLGENVVVGPFAVIGSNVTIGAGTVVEAFSHITGYTEIGKNCHIFSHAVVGSIPQDLKYQGEKTFLVIGDNNRIREFVTINPGTDKGAKTVIGNNNLIMAYCHVAHDCVIGNNNILANAANLAGYVVIEDNVVVGGLVAVHQFCRIGTYSIVGGFSRVNQDVVPYAMCAGSPLAVKTINLVGLRRAKFSNEKIKKLKKAFKIIFFDDHPFDKAKEIIESEGVDSEEIAHLLKFISSSNRGISR